MQYDYLIVGAGLYGAVFAHELTKKGKRCLVIDRRSHIAGNIYTDGSMLAILLFIFGFASGSILVPLQCYQAHFVKNEFAPRFFSWFYAAVGNRYRICKQVDVIMCCTCF